jgi:hypothetical protein
MNHWQLTAAFLFWWSPSVIFSQNQSPKSTFPAYSDSTRVRERNSSSNFEGMLDKAMNYQFAADSLSKLADSYRGQFQYNNSTDRGKLKAKISEAEKLATVNQRLASEALDPGSQKQKDSVSQKNVKSKVGNIQKKEPEIYSIFEVSTNTGGNVDKVPVNPEVPGGLIYCIQIAVFKNPAAPAYFKGITPVFGFKSVSSDITNYYGGIFRKMSDATKALSKVKALGFRDAFVVALFDKKIISGERAGILEKEWGRKPLLNYVGNVTPDTPRDTVPATLIFQVEVTRSQKPLKPEQLEVIKKLAGNRGLDIIKNASGQNIYLIGKFLTFESAAEYADLLTRNGQKDAKVAAYLGRKEIPVETAKQLFEKY